ncbi:hypothetical protein MTO96_034286 [Rhipicephalus appendiculatus]
MQKTALLAWVVLARRTLFAGTHVSLRSTRSSRYVIEVRQGSRTPLRRGLVAERRAAICGLIRRASILGADTVSPMLARRARARPLEKKGADHRPLGYAGQHRTRRALCPADSHPEDPFSQEGQQESPQLSRNAEEVESLLDDCVLQAVEGSP